LQYRAPSGSPRVGIISLVMRLPGCRSLKEKRSIIRRLQSTLVQENLSVAEVGDVDRRDASILACVAVSSSWEGTEKRLHGVRRTAEETFGVQLLEAPIERLI